MVPWQRLAMVTFRRNGGLSGVKCYECRVWTELAANSTHRAQRNNVSHRSEDLRCAVVAAVLGVSLIVLGVSLAWFADLRTVQSDQLKQVQAAQDVWDIQFNSHWKLTEWELFVNGTTVGRLSQQPIRTQILDDEEKTTVSSSKRRRQNLIGSAFSFAEVGNATSNDEGQGTLIPEKVLYPVNISVQASAPNRQPQMLHLYTGPLTQFQQDTGRWEISTRYGGPGCSVQRPAEVLSATRIPVVQWRNSTPPLMDTTQAWKSEVALYEAHDPYLFVANLTKGSMTLAESSVNSAACGIMAIVFGLVLLVPYVLMKALDMCEAQRCKRLVKFSPLSFDDVPLQQCTVSKC